MKYHVDDVTEECRTLAVSMTAMHGVGSITWGVLREAVTGHFTEMRNEDSITFTMGVLAVRLREWSWQWALEEV